MLSREQFIKIGTQIYEGKYDLDNVEYNGIYENVEIECKSHGKFTRSAFGFIYNRLGCPTCHKRTGGLLRQRKFTLESFKQRAIETWGNRWDYSLVEIKSKVRQIRIICPKHGEFSQDMYNHLFGHIGCPKCDVRRDADLMKEDFISRGREMYNGKYNYDNVVYVNNRTPVLLTCPEHGQFHVTPRYHLYNFSGCPECVKSEKKLKVRKRHPAYLSLKNIGTFEYSVIKEALAEYESKLKLANESK